jgi:Outer membrane protein beta-barrel domain
MKKISLATVFMLLAFTASWSQISLGVKAGLNESTQVFDGGGWNINPTFRPGILLGGFVQLKVISHFSLQPEIYYSMQGSNVGPMTYKADYVNVPVLIRWNITEKFNLHAGPQFGLLLTGKQNTPTTYSDFKSLDVGIVVGVGLELPMHFNVGFRTITGTTNVMQDNLKTANVSDIKSFVAQIFVGYTLFGK